VTSVAAVDIFSGWTEVVAVPEFTPDLVGVALDVLTARMPVPVIGVISAKGTIQAGPAIAEWACARGHRFSSTRPHSFDELRAPDRSDGTHNIFMRGYSGADATDALNNMYGSLTDFLNVFTARRGTGDQAPASPYRRLLAASALREHTIAVRDPGELSQEIAVCLAELELRHLSEPARMTATA
jgi:hypothetical protein